MNDASDRELVAAAAKAAGIGGGWYWPRGAKSPLYWRGEDGRAWLPFTDDGDALRLAGSLGLVVDCSRPSAGEPFNLHYAGQEDFTDLQAAIRRAIVRAAAEIGARNE